MKNRILLLLLSLAVFSACGQHLCPTYSDSGAGKAHHAKHHHSPNHHP